MILYRDLQLNLSSRRIESLNNDLHIRLPLLDLDFELGLVGTTMLPVRYLQLPVAANGQLGQQLMSSFWAWGDSDDEVMNNLARVLRNLAQVIGEVLTEAATVEP